jgi:uncharacterized membrane protein YcaP (DUF421 family)
MRCASVTLAQPLDMLTGECLVFGCILDGTPIVVYQRGKWYKDRMDMVRSQPHDVLTAVRDQGLKSIDKVKLAVPLAEWRLFDY